jgi:hypothetical protein
MVARPQQKRVTLCRPTERLVDEEFVEQALREAADKQRKHAGFFHWPDKPVKESGLLSTLVEAAIQLGIDISEPRAVPEGQDPPDAWARIGGRRVAIEFTELVDESRIREAAKVPAASWREWSDADILREVEERIRRKDHGGFGKGIEYCLVLHCDEPLLTEARLRGLSDSWRPLKVVGLDRCLILLSYCPQTQGYPLLEVVLERAA